MQSVYTARVLLLKTPYDQWTRFVAVVVVLLLAVHGRCCCTMSTDLLLFVLVCSFCSCVSWIHK